MSVNPHNVLFLMKQNLEETLLTQINDKEEELASCLQGECLLKVLYKGAYVPFLPVCALTFEKSVSERYGTGINDAKNRNIRNTGNCIRGHSVEWTIRNQEVHNFRPLAGERNFRCTSTEIVYFLTSSFSLIGMAH